MQIRNFQKNDSKNIESRCHNTSLSVKEEGCVIDLIGIKCIVKYSMIDSHTKVLHAQVFLLESNSLHMSYLINKLIASTITWCLR